MTRVFLAGPIDYRPIDEVIEYRFRLSDELDDAGFELVDQYSGVLQQVTQIDFENPDLGEIRRTIEELPDEPYVTALRHAIDEHSLIEVMGDPGLVPQEMRPETVEALVHHDLELVASADALLAYLPQPSCGTTVELLEAHDRGMPSVVITESPPTFVRYYADRVVPDADAAMDALAELTEE